MTADEIERLIRRLNLSEVTEIDISDETSSLSLRLAPRRAEARPPEPPEPPARMIRAEAIGRLRLRHPEAASPEPSFPRSVRRGDIVAFLDDGSLLRAVAAPEDCTIGPPALADGSLVGYADALFPIL